MMWKKTSITLMLLFLCFGLNGQHRFMVFFADKTNTPYSINTPEAFLSERAIQRRSKQGISITNTDLPVDPNYVAGVAALDAETYFTTKWMNGLLIQTDSSVLPLIEALPYVTKVELVAPNILLSKSADETPSQPETVSIAASSNVTASQLEMLGINRMHQDGFRGEGILIGVFDSGFENYLQIDEFSHLVADNRVLYTRDFTTNAFQVENNQTHGTRVLSAIAGNSETYIGSAPNATYILSVTEAPQEYRIEEYNWVFAAEMADSAGVDIIQTSLGYTEFDDETMDYSPSDMDGETAVISKAAQLAADKGILLITSAGNLGNTAWQIISAPADVADVIAVGGINQAGFKANTSSVGPSADDRIKPDVVALGVSTALVASNGAYVYQNGTSFAAPIVSGFAAGLWQAYPELTAAELRTLIRNSANISDEPNNLFGYGVPSYTEAKELMKPLNLKTGEIRVFPNPVAGQSFVTIALDDEFAGALELAVANLQGETIQQLDFGNGIANNRLEINLEGMPSGLYFIRINSNGRQVTKKLMIN